eukprot:scaffold321827_cov36-Tisochrysis_lutea.AAC.1
MVPLYPNELIPTAVVPGFERGQIRCVGRLTIRSEVPMRLWTIAFIRRSCALPNQPSARISATTLARPIKPETGSEWPTVAFAVPTRSPSDVPVPCASIPLICAEVFPALLSEQRSNALCADPFGAVKLALLPSCRTTLPHSIVLLTDSTVDEPSINALMASDLT